MSTIAIRFRSLKRAIGVAGLLLACTLPLNASAAYATVTIEGQKQGLIQGDNKTPGQENTIVALAYTHNIKLPVDPQSGLPTGSRAHGPVGIIKNIDRSSPLLFNAITSGERLTKVTIKLYATDASGVLRNTFTIELLDAMIINIDTGGSAQVASAIRETVSLVYRRIIWTDLIGGTSGADDWKEPMV